jgi:hypothetical protein
VLNGPPYTIKFGEIIVVYDDNGFAHRMNKHRSFTHQKFRKRPNLHRNVTGEKGSEENPFVNRRKKLVEDARRIREELEVEEAAERARLKKKQAEEKARATAELVRKLKEAREALINDIQATLAELPPLQMETAGSTVITSEAFAWFYDESEPLVALRRCTLASGSSDRTIKLWNANTGECLRTLKPHNGSVVSVAFSPDGTTLASGSDDKAIKLWNANTGECLRTLEGHNSYVVSVVFSPDGTTLASGSYDNTIKLWNANTGECLRTLEGHNSSAVSVAFSPDGTTLASGSYDKTIKLWNANTGEGLRTLKEHNSYVFSVAFSPIDKTFSRHDLNQIFIEVRAMLRQADFDLSTKDGIEFTVSWEALE